MGEPYPVGSDTLPRVSELNCRTPAGLTWALTFSISCCSRWISLFISWISFLRLRRLSQWVPEISRSSSYCRTERSEPWGLAVVPLSPLAHCLSLSSNDFLAQVLSGFSHLLCSPSPFHFWSVSEVLFWAALHSQAY